MSKAPCKLFCLRSTNTKQTLLSFSFIFIGHLSERMWLALAALSSSLVPLAHEQRDHARRAATPAATNQPCVTARTGLCDMRLLPSRGWRCAWVW